MTLLVRNLPKAVNYCKLKWARNLAYFFENNTSIDISIRKQ